MLLIVQILPVTLIVTMVYMWYNPADWIYEDGIKRSYMVIIKTFITIGNIEGISVN